MEVGAKDHQYLVAVVMYSTSSTTYTAKHQARCLCAVAGEKHRFMVGTCSVREENEIHVLNYDEGSNVLTCIGSLQHPLEVVCINASPYDAGKLGTCGGLRTGSYEAALWSWKDAMDEWIDDDPPRADEWAGKSRGALTPIAKLNDACQDGYLRSFLWCPKEHQNEHFMATVDGSHLRTWDASGSTTLAKPVAVFNTPDAHAAAWSPHDRSELAIATETDLLLFDARGAATKLPQPHDGATLDLDYNPNKPSALATAGDDGQVKFWDLRSFRTPLKILKTGSHWCTAVKYNPFHDQLLASANADNLVHLWRVSSISSAPLLELGNSGDDDDDDDLNDDVMPQQDSDDDDKDPLDDDHLHLDDDDDDDDAKKTASGEATAADVEVSCFDLHDDAVYGLAWSAADAWIFASLSFDGRLVLNHVPTPEKYKILL